MFAKKVLSTTEADGNVISFAGIEIDSKTNKMSDTSHAKLKMSTSWWG